SRACARERARSGVRRDSEPRGRRRHARRPAAPPPAARPSLADGACDDLGGGGRVKVVVLSGGVGGARFVRGVGNVGDDLEVLGVYVSPDLDSILYALAGLNDEQRGWGRADESWRALETVA